MAIEIAWNDLIIDNFRDQIEIDTNSLKAKLENFGEKKVENLLLSEIIFTINEKKNLTQNIMKLEKV